MRTRAFALATFAALSGALAAAQTPGRPAPSQPAHMTIAGCLKSSPNPSGVPDTTTYTLEPIEPAKPKMPTSSQPEPPAGKPVTRYTLTSSAAVDFKPHVGHKVEITGHLKDLSPAKPDPTAPPDPATKPPQPGGAHNTFEVTALKIVAATCP